MKLDTHPAGQFRVVVVGGGVAAIEAALALQELAGSRVSTTLLAPELTFSYRPLSVREPFCQGRARGYPLAAIAADAGAELCCDSLHRVDPRQHVVYTEGGIELGYDALLLAYGACVRERFKHVRTIDDRHLDERLHGLVRDVEDGYVRRLAFVATAPPAWPLPLYELALMTARAAHDMGSDVAVTIVTPEPAPLAVFGDRVSQAVSELLVRNRISLIPSTNCDVPGPGRVTCTPGTSLRVDSVIALPQLVARQTPGVAESSWLGFIPVDRRCRVAGVDDVYAAGDATDFPIKHGGIAAQQADTAAAMIAASAGAAVQCRDFAPVLEGMLLGGDRPVFMRTALAGDGPPTSEVSETPLWHPASKIAARRLGPYLERLDCLAPSAAA
jgi:sulfide:quinone oxidoreductase